jgi:hypothetical protein
MHISINRWEKTPDSYKKTEGEKRFIYLRIYKKWVEVELKETEISPLYGEITLNKPWEGSIKKKPWEYEVTAVIPCLNTHETLKIIIEILRLQTIKPYIIIIDTGSFNEVFEETKKLRSADVEVHSIALNGVRHPSDYPAMAMDIGFSLCRTPYLFATHADCFLRKKTFLEELLELCKNVSPAVGYELSPRAHEDWVGMISHTASMYDMRVMDQINFSWSLRKLCNRFNVVDYSPDPMKPNWPDTEILGNYILRENNIKPLLIGKEGNQTRTLDENIDHFRSYTAAKMYSPKYFKTTLEWFEDAKKEALKRIEEWKSKNYPQFL